MHLPVNNFLFLVLFSPSALLFIKLVLEISCCSMEIVNQDAGGF
jgi:hypothetical protein